MRTLLVGLAGSLVALVGFASTANAGATIDLLWGGVSTNATISTSTSITLNVIYTNDVANIGASLSLDYSSLLGLYSVTNVTNNPGNLITAGVLPLALGPTNDSGTIIESFNAGALPPYVGTGLGAGQSWLIGSITFHKDADIAPAVLPVFTFLGLNDSVNDGAGGSVPASQVTMNGATLTNVPEPATLSMLALGLGGIALAGRRRRV